MFPLTKWIKRLGRSTNHLFNQNGRNSQLLLTFHNLSVADIFHRPCLKVIFVSSQAYAAKGLNCWLYLHMGLLEA